MNPEPDDPRREQARAAFEEAYRRQLSGDLDAAEALYKESIAHFPTAEAHTFLGWTYSHRHRLDEAIAQCRKAIEVDPSFGNPYNDIGAYLVQKGQVDEAIPWFEQALEAPRYESYCFPHVNLARVYEGKRLWRRALSEYRKALAERPGYKPAEEGMARMRGHLN